MCENLDVTANLFLGQEPVVAGWTRFLPDMLRPLDTLDMELKALEAIDRLDVRTLKSVRAKVGVLSGGQRQAIAIARAVGSRVIDPVARRADRSAGCRSDGPSAQRRQATTR